jgi:hypothetical protein
MCKNAQKEEQVKRVHMPYGRHEPYTFTHCSEIFSAAA